MLKIKLIGDFPINDVDDYNRKENIIDDMQVLFDKECEDYDDRLLKFYDVSSLDNVSLNGFISGQSEIYKVGYFPNSSTSYDALKQLKNGVTLKELMDLIRSKKIRIVSVDFCDKSEFTGKIKTTNRRYEHLNMQKVKNTTTSILESYIARKTFNRTDSALRSIFTPERISKDINYLIESTKINNAQKLFISEK